MKTKFLITRTSIFMDDIKPIDNDDRLYQDTFEHKYITGELGEVTKWFIELDLKDLLELQNKLRLSLILANQYDYPSIEIYDDYRE